MNYAEFKKKFGISEKQAEAEPSVDSGAEDDKLDAGAGTGEGNTGADGGKENISLAAMNKGELFKFIAKKRLYDASYKKLEPDAIIPLVLEKARNKIVEAELKTAEEAAALSEGDLIALFDTIGK